jgi:hypothetical protein
MKQKPVILRGPHATPEDVAKQLGVGKIRLKQIKKLMKPGGKHGS